MATWASKLATSAPPVPSPPAALSTQIEGDSSYAVLDASALIGVSGLHRIADKCVITPEVYNEVTDKSSRQALENLPFGIEQLEPAAESVAAVAEFAKATGDVHSLSTADIRLIALAHMLHIQRHGKDGLRHQAAQARPAGRGRRTTRALPGWGSVGEEWAELDKINQDELDAQDKLIAASRISNAVQELDLEARLLLSDEATNSEAGTNSQAAREDERQGPVEVASREGEHGEWEPAAVSHGAARRYRRKQRKAHRRCDDLPHDSGPSSSADPEVAAQDQREEEWIDDADQEESDCCEAEDSAQEDEEQCSLACSDPSQNSSVCIATADFAMQNVILQMGLRLVAPDGRQIRRISKWVLRCSACFKVTKEMERMFCPACGNAALETVEVVVGKDGAEVYGVRKRHIIRGTRFSLPKPKGGKNSSDPILREDMYLLRMPKRKQKKESSDPFAPEFSSSTWHDPRFSNGQHGKGVAAALASWKHNPNERRHSRTNRR